MDGATRVGFSPASAAGAGEGSGAEVFLPCCTGPAKTAVEQTKATTARTVRNGRLLRNRINVLPVSSRQERPASEPSLKRHCTRDAAYKARQKIVRLHQNPRRTCRESSEAAGVARRLHNGHN